MQKIMNMTKKGKPQLFCTLNRNKVKHFLSVLNEVEDTYIQLEYEILTPKQLEEISDNYFANKLARYEHLMKLINDFINSVLGNEVEPLPLVEKIFRFKKEFVYSV